MNFEFSEEHKMLSDMTYKFAVTEFTPHIRECDEHEKYTRDIIKKGADNGLVGAWITEEYGGPNAGFVGNCIITEQLSRVDMGIGLNVMAACFGCEAIFQYGSEEQKKKLSEATKGRPKPEEWKRKIGEGAKRRWARERGEL